MKCEPVPVPEKVAGRSPCGERGLKCLAVSQWLAERASLPVRGAWVEIEQHVFRVIGNAVAPRAGSVG